MQLKTLPLASRIAFKIHILSASRTRKMNQLTFFDHEYPLPDTRYQDLQLEGLTPYTIDNYGYNWPPVGDFRQIIKTSQNVQRFANTAIRSSFYIMSFPL